ncbi:MAG: type II toxin-antitoxin system antitoxin SocA domain-containing protein [Thermodesulfobacteriota bacterium]
MATLNDVSDYIIAKCVEGGVGLNLLKLQKLVYYCQAWSLAFNRGPLFPGRFQAWVHGPVCRDLYDRFNATKSLYSPVDSADIMAGFDAGRVGPEERQLIDAVLNSYAGFSGDQLETMTHTESPWLEARKGYAPMDRCEVELNENTMKEFYAARLKQ